MTTTRLARRGLGMLALVALVLAWGGDAVAARQKSIPGPGWDFWADQDTIAANERSFRVSINSDLYPPELHMNVNFFENEKAILDVLDGKDPRKSLQKQFRARIKELGPKRLAELGITDLKKVEVHEAMRMLSLREGHFTFQQAKKLHSSLVFKAMHGEWSIGGTSVFERAVLDEWAFFCREVSGSAFEDLGVRAKFKLLKQGINLREGFLQYLSAIYTDNTPKGSLPKWIRSVLEARPTRGPIPEKYGQAGGACALCFVAGTTVWTEEGKRPIETIKPGDRVWSRDTQRGEFLLATVDETIMRPDRPVMRVDVVSGSGERESFESTTDHPFWVEGRGWTEASQLNEHDAIASTGEETLEVTSVEKTSRHAAVYNLSVPGPRTFYVGDIPVLVHNGTCGGIKSEGLGRMRGVMKGLGVLMFIIPFVTDALRATSYNDFSQRALSTLISTALFLPVGLIVAYACPPCGVALAVVGAVLMLYELATALEEKIWGTHWISDQVTAFWDTIGWWMTSVFHPNKFGSPIPQIDDGVYYN